MSVSEVSYVSFRSVICQIQKCHVSFRSVMSVSEVPYVNFRSVICKFQKCHVSFRMSCKFQKCYVSFKNVICHFYISYLVLHDLFTGDSATHTQHTHTYTHTHAKYQIFGQRFAWHSEWMRTKVIILTNYM